MYNTTHRGTPGAWCFKVHARGVLADWAVHLTGNQRVFSRFTHSAFFCAPDRLRRFKDIQPTRGIGKQTGMAERS